MTYHRCLPPPHITRYTGRCLIMLLGVLLAASCGTSAKKGGGASASDASDASGASDASDAARTNDAGEASSTPVPMIQAALAQACAPNAKHGIGVSAGTDLLKVSLKGYPNALCNDGSPAVMYVRPAKDEASKHEWLFHLQGGGVCLNYEECQDRWCSKGAFLRSKMTSTLAPEGMLGPGIFQRTAPDGSANVVASGNQVWVYYCSSDAYQGQKDDVIYVDPNDPNRTFRMFRRGHSIMEAVVAELSKGVTTAAGTLPPLTEAEQIVFTGTSAGSGGAQTNIDWFAGQLPLSTKVFGVFDAAIAPDRTLGDNAELEALGALLENTDAWNIEMAKEERFLDESCLTYHSKDPWRCSDRHHVMKHHISTPYFVRHDLLDPPAFKTFAAFMSAEKYAGWMRASLMILAEVPAQSEEKATISRTPGVFSQACKQHVGLTSEAYTFKATLEDSAGTPHSFMTAFLAWVGGQDIQWVQGQEQDQIGQTCPATTAAVD